MGFIKRSIDALAKMGLVFRSDPPKIVNLAGREWGREAGGLQLSIAAFGGDWRTLSVILRNADATPKKVLVADWLHFAAIHITAPSGSLVSPTPYGRESLKRNAAKSRFEAPLGPHAALEFQLPIGLLFDLSAPGSYSTHLTCEVPARGGPATLSSNDLVPTHA